MKHKKRRVETNKRGKQTEKPSEVKVCKITNLDMKDKIYNKIIIFQREKKKATAVSNEKMGGGWIERTNSSVLGKKREKRK